MHSCKRNAGVDLELMVGGAHKTVKGLCMLSYDIVLMMRTRIYCPVRTASLVL